MQLIWLACVVLQLLLGFYRWLSTRMTLALPLLLPLIRCVLPNSDTGCLEFRKKSSVLSAFQVVQLIFFCFPNNCPDYLFCFHFLLLLALCLQNKQASLVSKCFSPNFPHCNPCLCFVFLFLLFLLWCIRCIPHII